ncbi:MAG TPA: hypothetical protein VL598_02565 [Trinickia sp.]|jgi:hypothetical protein|uniref:hypothetical protein n=1 Tax=Trinickia sp. TaxID=2571163 RepID=UPI002BC20D56|nr:hypothetical protein [Trinickia sp.]HTI16529.1 hypothetical protein [Trinickia sp.]
MFVGDVHNESNTMAAFSRALPGLAGKLDVILLEYYPKDMSPVGKGVDEIEADLQSFKKHYRRGVAAQVHQMSTLAAKNGIDVRGIEVPTPKQYQDKKSFLDNLRYTKWRTGEEVNRKFLGSVERYAVQSKGGQSVSFGMFVGRSHLGTLKKLAPDIAAYEPSDDGGLKPYLEKKSA